MKLTSSLARWLCFWAMVTLLHAQVSFTVASSSVSPNTTRTTAQYTIQLNAITSFSTNFDVSVTFSSAFSLGSVSGCQLSINGAVVSSAVCALTTASNQVTFSSLSNSATINNLTLVFSTGTALYAGSFVASLSYFQPSTPSNSYGSNSAPLTITSTVMPCSLTSTSSTVGGSTNFTFSYSPSVYISAGSILQVQFSPWSAYNLTNFPGFTSSAVCAGACTIRSPNQAQSFFNQILTYSSLYSSSSTANMSLNMVNGRNPASMQPTTISATLLHYLSASSQIAYMTCSTTFTATSPNQFTGVSFTPSSLAISSTNAVSLVLNLTNPISSISYLSVSYSADLSISFSFVQSNQATTPKVFPSGSANSFYLGSLTNSTTSFSTLFLLSFSFTNAPYGNYPVSLTLQTMNLVGTIYYPIDTMTLSYTFTPSGITSASVTALSSSIGVTTVLSFIFTSVNTLITNSKILLTIPSQISTTNTSSCICSVSSTCTLLNSSTFLININSAAVTGGSTFTITLNNIVNPLTTTPTSSFSLTTYYYNTSTPTDTLATNVTLTATPVLLSSATVSSSSLTVAANSTYTVTFTNTNPLPSGSSVVITFPSDFSNSAGASLTSFKISGVTQSGCTLTVLSTMSFQFNSCITTSAASSTSFSIQIGSIINPSSTKPTGTFTVQTYYNSLLMEYMNSSLTVTLTTATSLLSSGISAVSLSVNAITSYTFTLGFSQTYSSGSRILLTLPSLVTLLSGFVCSSGTSGVTISCFQSTSSLLNITMTGTIPSSLTWTITNIQNAWYSQSQTFSYTTTTNDAANYYMEKGSSSVTVQPVTLSVSYVPNNQLVLLSASVLNIQVTNPFAVVAPIPSLLKLTITLPAELTLTNTTCLTSISATPCTSASSSQIAVTTLTAFNNTLNVTFSANAAYFTTSSAFNLFLLYNDSIISSNVAFTVNSYCQSPCKNCSNAASQCTSCLPSPYTALNNYFSGNNSCLATCPATYFVAVNSTTCQSCNSSACLNCVTTANTCTSCSDPNFLSGSSCVQTCPNTYYGSSNLCVVCINQCYNCTNSTYCLSCLSSYSLNPDKTCKSTCPSGYVSVSSYCNACTANCLTCQSSTSNCTSCVSPYFLSNNSCVQTCPNTFYGSNSSCVTCINQCYNCTNATYCLSCSSGYSLNPDQTCLLTCPSGYVTVSSVCTACTSNCLTCQTTTSNCTSCVSPYYLSGTNCVQTCPDTYFGNSSLCITCINQCKNCTNATYCLSCVTSYSLNPDKTCQTTCPSGYVSISSVCTLCTDNCVTCVSSTNTCTSCSNPYFLSNSSCVLTCPSTFFGNGTLCTTCINQCSTCTNSTYCLSCISSYSLNPDNTCQTTCPSGYVSSSSVCIICTNNCLTCVTNTSVCTSCTAPYFLSGSSCVQICPNTYFGNSTLCTACINQCYNCTSATYCLSCISSFSLNPDHTCLSTCPSGYVSQSSVCVVCTNNCKTCSGVTSNCTSCADPYFLTGNSCVQTCPNTFYGSSNICVNCINQCYNCTNATNCLSCVSPYSLNPDNTCKTTCPSGYVTVLLVCTSCTSNCLTCQSTTSNCTSCSVGYILYNNSCILACPVGQYQDSNKQCQACISPCKYCLSATICVSCVSNYSLYNSTQCLSTCPAGTFTYTYYCSACNSTCQTCYNAATNCTSCYSGTYYYLNSCYSTCPEPTYAYQGTCTICVAPCATCLNSALLCSSCNSSYYLLNTSCVLSCPSTGYVQANGTCISCPSNCLGCSSSIACSTCSSGYYLYQGGCLSSCPSTSPILVNQTCNSCSSQCATCQGSPDYCLTCTLYYFKYSYTCVTSCPLSYYSNIMTYTCQSGLSSKIVFFPVLITYLVILVVVAAFKIFTHSTSFPTVVTSLSGLIQIIISAYLLSLLTQSYLQLGLNYSFPQAMIAISLIFTAAINIIHFRANFQRLSDDQYVRKWQNVNVNYTYLVVIRYISLFTHCKFFRIIYSKLLNSLHFSMAAQKFRNVFTVSTAVTLSSLFLSEAPLIIAAFYLAYNKLLKDQVFYTSIECLLIVIISAVISLIDIHKAEDYFQDTEFMTTKRYLEKVNNDSLNKLEDEYRQKDEGSMDGEKFVGTSGGKFVFSRRDPNSMNQILLEEGSAATDAYETKTKPNKKLIFQEEKDYIEESDKSDLSPRSSKSKTKAASAFGRHSKSKINIFEPIQEEEAEYYEILKYDEEEFKTAAKIEQQRAQNQSQQEGQLQLDRKEEFGRSESQVDDSDNRSMLEYRERRQQWNQIIEHRQKLASQIFNTIDTKELYRQLQKIEEPLNEDEYDIDEKQHNFRQLRHQPHLQQQQQRDQAPEGQQREKRRRRKKGGRRGNKELEEIYLQRLAEKVDPKKKTIYASSKTFKYQF